MANRVIPTTIFGSAGGSQVVAGSGKVGRVKPKRGAKQKPRQPVDRFGGLGLPHGYLPIDPTTHAGAAEHQAIRDLIEQRTGRPVPEGMDVGVALREAGLIQAPRRRPFSAGSSSGVFASEIGRAHV